VVRNLHQEHYAVPHANCEPDAVAVTKPLSDADADGDCFGECFLEWLSVCLTVDKPESI
jgi:hypothetical protein